MNFLSFGISVPANFSNSGFGSNVSTCDGPPFIMRKMQLFAFAGKCGFLGARGPRGASARDSDASSPASATPANPPPISQMSSRRVRPQGKRGISTPRFRRKG